MNASEDEAQGTLESVVDVYESPDDAERKATLLSAAVASVASVMVAAGVYGALQAGNVLLAALLTLVAAVFVGAVGAGPIEREN